MTTALADTAIADILDFLGVQAEQPDVHTLDKLMAAYIRHVPWESASRIVRRHQLADQALERAVA